MVKKRMAAFLAGLCVLCLLAGAALGEESALNLLLIGTDTYEEDAAGRSDAMLLMRIEPKSKEVRLVSFLRDLYVPIPGCGSTRLNAAYYFGGEELLKTALSKNFGVSVDRTVKVNFSLLADVIDWMGGVELEVSPQELTALNDVLRSYNRKMGLGVTHGLLENSGLQRLDGKQALSYSRIRKLDSDFKRVGRQQAVLQAMGRQMKELSFFQLARLATLCLGKVRTDLTLADINRLLPLLGGEEEIRLSAACVPFEGTYTDETVNGMQVLKPDLSRNRRKLQSFLEISGQ